MPAAPLPFEERFRRKTERVPSGCLVFTGCRNKKGYGYIAFRGKLWQAHRAAWTHFRGEIPDGLQIDHLCYNPSCVDVTHMELVTPLENRLRRRTTFLGVCRNGHPYGNTCYGGYRACSICRRESARRRYWRDKALRSS